MSVVDDPARPDPTPATASTTRTAPPTRAGSPSRSDRPDRRGRPDRPGQTDRPGRPASGLFRAFWRWHFYGAVVVVPVLLVLAVTGLVYLFRFQIEPLVHGDLMRVEHVPGQLTQPAETQLEMVQKADPGATVVSYTEPSAPDESSRFTVTTADGATRDVFVDTYTLDVLGSLDPDATISGTAVRLHADLMAGRVGETVMELGASWAIVMTITGYYLFVRGRRARRRQRERHARSARLRTTHARVGAVVGVGLMALLVTGLPWTEVWGGAVQKVATTNDSSMWAEDPGALSNPTSTLDESLPHSHHAVPWGQEKSEVPRSNPRVDGDEESVANLDTAIEVADREGLAHPLTVALPADDGGVYSAIGYAFHDPSAERTVHVDRYGGQVVSSYGYDDYPALAKVVAQGISVHEGRRFGTLNFWLTAAFCVAVVISCVTGPLMWWRRRPRGAGSVGAPRGRMPLAASPLLAVGVVALCLFLPVFGASLLLVLLLDRFVLRRVPRLAKAFNVT